MPTNGFEVQFSNVPLIGDEAPEFSAMTTKGPVNFPEDYRGKWAILFSHPADFTPVCTSELMTFAAMQEDFRKLNTELLGISVDSISSHLAWIKKMEDELEFNGMKNIKIAYPIVADVKMEVAKKYGMIQPRSSDTKAVRSVFFIDSKGIVRALIYYPMSNGRNFEEIRRLLLAMQTSDAFDVATPADWQPGDKVLVAAPTTIYAMEERAKDENSELQCEDWFFCMKDLPSDRISARLNAQN